MRRVFGQIFPSGSQFVGRLVLASYVDHISSEYCRFNNRAVTVAR